MLRDACVLYQQSATVERDVAVTAELVGLEQNTGRGYFWAGRGGFKFHKF